VMEGGRDGKKTLLLVGGREEMYRTQRGLCLPFSSKKGRGGRDRFRKVSERCLCLLGKKGRT